jgi:hypothetical protein
MSQVPMPHLQRLLGGPLVLECVGQDGLSPDMTLRALDACLGVPGLPQSATGQTSLFTGINAQAMVGDHITAHPTAALRELISEHSLLKRAAEAGARVLFANAHSEHFWQMVQKRRLRLGASTLTAIAAGATIPTLSDLLAGQAVLWDITHEIATRHLDYDLPLVPPEEAGTRLARLAGEHDLVLFETFLPDLAGHRRIEPEWVLSRLDRFLGAILAERTSDTTLVLCSDHGNLEDSTCKIHTANPVPLLAVGPAAGLWATASAITDVSPAILCALGVSACAEDGRRPRHRWTYTSLEGDHESRRTR